MVKLCSAHCLTVPKYKDPQPMSMYVCPKIFTKICDFAQFCSTLPSLTMTAAAMGRYEDTTRTWTHIKVLYILSILLSAVVLALFVVCFMMVLEVQRGLNSEVTLRKVCTANPQNTTTLAGHECALT